MLKINKTTLSGRRSTINNAFVHEIIFHPGNKTEENKMWLKRFGQIQGEEKCVYCGERAGTIDHIFNLTIQGLPSGYNSDYNNLVPCCKDCNSKKGATLWQDYMKTDEMIKIEGHEQRFEVLEKILKKYPPFYFDFKEVVGEEKWNNYIKMKEELLMKMDETSEVLIKLRKLVYEHYLEEQTRQ